jgi:hypothetical protein
MSDSRKALAAAISVVGDFARRQESFPGNASRIINPRLFGPGVTAIGLPLLDDGAVSLMQAHVNFIQLVFVLDLNAEMVEASLAAPR